MKKLFTDQEFSTAKGNTLLTLECKHCKLPFQKSKTRIKRLIKLQKGMYCNRKCHFDSLATKRLDIDCTFCGKRFSRTSSKIEQVNYCSRSCAASTNNVKHPKRIAIVVTCKHCGTPTGKTRGRHKTICEECRPKPKPTKQEYIDRANYQVHSIIRNQARSVYYGSNLPKYCVTCGYNKTFHVCHIKAIKDYPPDALISEINSLDNLVALCPNHHWELDHDMLPLEDVLHAKNSIMLQQIQVAS